MEFPSGSHTQQATWLQYLYIINLERRHDKWLYWLDNARKHGIVDNDGQPIGRRWLGTDGINIQTLYDIPVHLDLTKLSRGEVGAFCSHVRIWKDIVEQGHPYAVVFEDDVQFVDNFREKFTDQFEWICNNLGDWDIIYLGGRQLNSTQPGYCEVEFAKPSEYYHQTEYKLISGDSLETPIIFCNKLFFMGAFSYCISNKFARELLNHLRTAIQLKSLDLMIRIYQCHADKRAYFCNPLLTYSDSEMGGDIEHVEKPKNVTPI